MTAVVEAAVVPSAVAVVLVEVSAAVLVELVACARGRLRGCLLCRVSWLGSPIGLVAHTVPWPAAGGN